LKSSRNGRYVVATALILAIGIPSVALGFGEGRNMLLGKRNPSSNALNSETQIIANNGSYGTRQSNKKDGDGGGAIYGCRSATGKEPCIRSNNLKDGQAFQFETKGKEGGSITVGDTTGAPFTTNATGHVANLDADKLDGKDSTEFAGAGDLAFAAVAEDGALAAGRGATASAKTGAVSYSVTFNKDVSKCSFTANVVGDAATAGSVGVSPGIAPNVNQVNVSLPGNPRAFHLQVIC
jgi:hypothetical protein